VSVRTTTSTLQGHDALCNMAQNMFHVHYIHKFMKKSRVPPRWFNRGSTWIR